MTQWGPVPEPMSGESTDAQRNAAHQVLDRTTDTRERLLNLFAEHQYDPGDSNLIDAIMAEFVRFGSLSGYYVESAED